MCAAYRRDIYEELGGFIKHTIFNEDMIYAAGAVKKAEKFLKENNNDVYKTASELCYLKADGDTSVKVGPIEIESPGSAFWVQLAVQYLEKSKKLNASGNSSSTTGYKTRMRRC